MAVAPGERRLALEEEHAAELDAAGDLAAAGALVEPALPGLRTLRPRQFGDQFVEGQKTSVRRRFRTGRGRTPDLGKLLGDPGCKRVGERDDGLSLGPVVKG